MTATDAVVVARFDTCMQSQGLSHATRKAYASDLKRTAAVSGLPMPLTSLDHEATAYVIREREVERLDSPASATRYLAAHEALRKSQKHGGDSPYRKRPTKGVVLPSIVPTVEQMQTFVESEPHPMWKALYAVLCGAGLRVSEVADLRWSDVMAESLRVVGKGRKVRTVPMGPIVKKAVWDWCALASPTDDERVFPAPVRTIQYRVKGHAAECGFGSDWHPHALRHGFGTAVQRTTGDLRLTADLLGHASVTTTTIYTHLADDDRRRAVAGVL